MHLGYLNIKFLMQFILSLMWNSSIYQHLSSANVSSILASLLFTAVTHLWWWSLWYGQSPTTNRTKSTSQFHRRCTADLWPLVTWPVQQQALVSISSTINLLSSHCFTVQYARHFPQFYIRKLCTYVMIVYRMNMWSPLSVLLLGVLGSIDKTLRISRFKRKHYFYIYFLFNLKLESHRFSW